jgi:hypothetical protein
MKTGRLAEDDAMPLSCSRSSQPLRGRVRLDGSPGDDPWPSCSFARRKRPSAASISKRTWMQNAALPGRGHEGAATK